MKIRRKAAPECVPAVPHRERFIALEGVSIGQVFGLLLTADRARRERRQDDAAGDIVEVGAAAALERVGGKLTKEIEVPKDIPGRLRSYRATDGGEAAPKAKELNPVEATTAKNVAEATCPQVKILRRKRRRTWRNRRPAK